MNARITVITLAGMLGVFVVGCSRVVSFKQDVYPILSRNCLTCHSPGGEGYAKSGLNMETYETLIKGTKFGPVVVPGSSIGSTLILLVEHKGDPSINMPKRKEQVAKEAQAHLSVRNSEQLSVDDIKLLKNWVDQGAKNN